jgi:hypothetical protein
MRNGQIDLHDYGRRLERTIQFLNVHTKVSRKNKQKILQFLERLKAEGLSRARFDFQATQVGSAAFR